MKIVKSFRWAINGLKTVWFEEFNFKIESLIAVVILFLAAIFSFTFSEWLAIIIAIILVISAEVVNTAIEDLCDKIQPETDPLIGKIKDTMAGYVLVVSLGATLIGILVFCNHFIF
ncbi:MAG: diacylglycerol kinase family protein [bacterium]